MLNIRCFLSCVQIFEHFLNTLRPHFCVALCHLAVGAKIALKRGKKNCKPLFRDLHFLCELFRSRIIKFYVIWLKNVVFRLFAHSFRPRPPFNPIFSFSLKTHRGTLLFLGFVFNCVPRCLLFLILYLPLRIYAGGFHAKTKIGCYLISAFTFLFVVLYPADTTIHFYHLVFPCISTCIIYYFSPVSATNKPLDDLEALHYKKMARKILFSEILFFLLILLIFNTQITFAFFFSFTIHLSVLALQITVELVSKNFFANL